MSFDNNFKDKKEIEIFEDNDLIEGGPKSEYTEEVIYKNSTINYIMYFTIQSIWDDKGNRITINLKEKCQPSKYIIDTLNKFLRLPNHLLHKNNHLKTNYVEEVLNSTSIYINNAIIDQSLITLLNTTFPKLSVINMSNSIIKPNCCFDSFKDKISFFNCTIESLICLNNLNTEVLFFQDGVVLKTPPVTINSKTLIMNSDKSNDDSYYEQFFLNCYFPKLDYLQLTCNNIDKALLFLPYSTPNIFHLEINSSFINNHHCLYNLHNLTYSFVRYYSDLEDPIWTVNQESYNRKYLNYSTDDIEIYLKRKYPKMVYKPDDSLDDEYYFVYDDVHNSICKRTADQKEHIYTTKWGSWITEDERSWVAKRKVSPVICPKPSIIHPTGKVLFFSINPHNYFGEKEKVSELKKENF